MIVKVVKMHRIVRKVRNGETHYVDRVRYKASYTKKGWALLLIISAYLSISFTFILNLENEVSPVSVMAYMVFMFFLSLGFLALWVKIYVERRGMIRRTE